MWNGIGWFGFIGPTTSATDICLEEIWSSGGPFVQWSGTIYAILVKSIMRNNSVKLF